MTTDAVDSTADSTIVPIGLAVPDRVLPGDVPHACPFECAVSVGHQDVNNVVAHVSNTVVLEWFNCAAQLHCDALGYTMAHMVDDGRMWFVARHEIDYRAETLPNDRLELFTWVRSVKGVKSWRDSVLYRPRDERVLSACSSLWVYVALASRRPGRIPTDVIRAMDPLESPAVRPTRP